MRRLLAAFLILGCAASLGATRNRVVREPIRAAVEPGEPVEDQAEITVAPPPSPAGAPAPKTCRQALALAKVTFADAAPGKTIVDPVKLAPSIGGVVFRYVDDPKPRWLWVDCKFALRLNAAAALLAERGVREVVHVGTYEPKCVGGGALPDCTPSAHARGMAIDVVALVREHDVVSFEKDFVKRTDATPTCQAPRVGEKDTFLKELVCALDGTFSVVLTPNWDQRHRTHAHLALLPTAKAWWANGVDPLKASE